MTKKPNIELVNKAKPDETLAHACGQCGVIYGKSDQAYNCCAPYSCRKCGSETKRYVLVCDDCRDNERWERDRADFQKAKKVALEEYEHEYVYLPQLDRYETVDDVPDTAACHEVSITYAYAVRPHQFPTPDAADIVEGLCEEMYEEARDDLDVDGLQKLLNEWYEKQTSHGFIQDDDRVVIFDEEGAKREMGPWE